MTASWSLGPLAFGAFHRARFPRISAAIVLSTGSHPLHTAGLVDSAGFSRALMPPCARPSALQPAALSQSVQPALSGASMSLDVSSTIPRCCIASMRLLARTWPRLRARIRSQSSSPLSFGVEQSKMAFFPAVIPFISRISSGAGCGSRHLLSRHLSGTRTPSHLCCHLCIRSASPAPSQPFRVSSPQCVHRQPSDQPATFTFRLPTRPLSAWATRDENTPSQNVLFQRRVVNKAFGYRNATRTLPAHRPRLLPQRTFR